MSTPSAMSEANKHTVIAGKAIGLADFFKYTVGKTVIEGEGTTGWSCRRPMGHQRPAASRHFSTSSLISSAGAPTIVVGTANPVDQKAELRTFSYVTETHRQRFKGSALPLKRPPTKRWRKFASFSPAEISRSPCWTSPRSPGRFVDQRGRKACRDTVFVAGGGGGGGVLAKVAVALAVTRRSPPPRGQGPRRCPAGPRRARQGCFHADAHPSAPAAGAAFAADIKPTFGDRLGNFLPGAGGGHRPFCFGDASPAPAG